MHGGEREVGVVISFAKRIARAGCCCAFGTPPRLPAGPRQLRGIRSDRRPNGPRGIPEELRSRRRLLTGAREARGPRFLRRTPQLKFQSRGIGVVGIAGAVRTGVFAMKIVPRNGADGLLVGNPAVLGEQATAVLATIAFAGVGSFAIVSARRLTMTLRHPVYAEIAGILFHMPRGARRSAFDPRTPLRLGRAVTIGNIASNVLFIRGFEPMPAFDKRGAAMRTVLSSGIVGAYAIWKPLFSGAWAIDFRGVSCNSDWDISRALFRFGLPTGLQGIAMNIAGVMLLRFVGASSYER